MKKMFLAALTVLGLSAAVAPTFAASTVAGDAAATRLHQTGGEGGYN